MVWAPCVIGRVVLFGGACGRVWLCPGSLTTSSVMEGICWRRPAVCCVLALCVGAWWVVMAAWAWSCVGLRGVWALCDLIGFGLGCLRDAVHILYG